ncbi:MAG: SDR family oxidoreductase [Chromatiales bacterium]|nr:SDR family oxidoreductase [Chromatiales bacterium]
MKTILITGCSTGIGLAVAQGLRDRGYRVFASARQENDVERLRQQGLESLRLDLADSNSIEEAAEEVLALTGGEIYALFNNGAYGQPGAVEDLSRKVLREQFETNVFGTHELTCKLIPAMRIKGEGRIIQNSSILGLVALPYRGAYVASKYALEGLTDTLRLELRGSGIHISLIEPGPIESRFRANALAAWKANVDAHNSAHRSVYAAMEARLEKKGAVAPGTLPAQALIAPVVHALESSEPKARYRVTWPTYLLSSLKRLLPTSTMDRILGRIGSQEREITR